MPLVMEATLRDAALYAGVAILLGLVSFLAPAERRRGVVAMAALALFALAGLWALARFGGRFVDRTLFEILREALLALLAIAVMRAVLQFVTRILLARFNVPTIVSDVLLGFALIAYALVRLDSVGVNIAGIVTTSAVITGAIAFSAQEVLGALWAGLALQADRTIRLGDWIRFDGVPGEIVSIRWRTTTMRTRNNELIIIPNAQLIKDRIYVLARAGSDQRPKREIPFLVSYIHPPSRVVATVDAALHAADLRFVRRGHPPRCLCTRFEDHGIAYSVYYEIDDHRRFREADSALLAHVFAALHRAGMRIPYPQRDVHLFREAGPEEARRREVESRFQALGAIRLFAPLTDQERRALASEVHPCLYAGGDILFRQGEAADSLFVLARGRVGVYDERADGARQPLATLEAPDCVGEMGLLTGQPRGATVVAEGDVECLRVDKAGFDAILRNRPEIVEELSMLLEQRQAENDAKLQALGHGERASGSHGRARDMVLRIRRFFSLAPGAGAR